MLNDHYSKLAPKTTTNNHVFTYEMSIPGVLKTQRVNNPNPNPNINPNPSLNPNSIGSVRQQH